MPISINEDLKPIVFIHTQKTAGHSIRVALESVGYRWKLVKYFDIPKQEWVIKVSPNKHQPPRFWEYAESLREKYKRKGKKHHADVVAVLDSPPLSECYSFSFVRNPFDACVSRFSYHQREDRNSPQDLLFKRFSNNKKGFSSWVKSLKTEGCWYDPRFNWRATFETQKRFLSDASNDKILVDFVGKFEHLNDDFQKICDTIGCDNNLKGIHENPSKRKSDYREYYDDEAIEIIESMYKEDLECFNYEF